MSEPNTPAPARDWNAVTSANRVAALYRPYTVKLEKLGAFLERQGERFAHPLHDVLRWASNLVTGDPVRPDVLDEARRLLAVLAPLDDATRRRYCETRADYRLNVAPGSPPWQKADWIEFLRFSVVTLGDGALDADGRPAQWPHPTDHCHALAFTATDPRDPPVVVPLTGPEFIKHEGRHLGLWQYELSAVFYMLRRIAVVQYEDNYRAIVRAWRDKTLDASQEQPLAAFLERPTMETWEAARDFVVKWFPTRWPGTEDHARDPKTPTAGHSPGEGLASAGPSLPTRDQIVAELERLGNENWTGLITCLLNAAPNAATTPALKKAGDTTNAGGMLKSIANASPLIKRAIVRGGKKGKGYRIKLAPE